VNNLLLSRALAPVYGAETHSQFARYSSAMQAFATQFGSDDEILIFRAPGRVNLIGEHTDYNHGFVMPAALDKDVLLLVRPRTDGEIHLVNHEADFAPVTFAIRPEIPSGPAGDWGNFARGAAQTLAQYLDRSLVGFDGLVVGAPPHGVPRGAGLSSSSALTVVMAVALAELADWRPQPQLLAQLCSDAEWYVGTRGGIMDQFAALLGRRDHALFLDCRPGLGGAYRYEPIPLPTTHRLLVVDSGVKHRNVYGEFNQRVAACRAGVALLRRDRPDITHLRDLHVVSWGVIEPLLPETITPAELRKRDIALADLPGLAEDTPLRVRACCRHVWTENHRVLLAVDALRLDEIDELGRLMNEAHASAGEDYRISAPELETLVAAAREVDGCAGARLTGAGWGGCIVALVETGAVKAVQHHIEERFESATGRRPASFECRAGPGAGRVGDH
jgi:galactokinase